VKKAFADPAGATGTENRHQPACVRKERSLENDPWMMAPMTASGIDHQYGGGIGGWRNRRGCCPGK
jgi:hypothetical protein